MFSESENLRFLSVDDNTIREVLSPFSLRNFSSPVGVDYDAATQQVYWTDIVDDTVSVGGLQGGNRRQVVRGLSIPGGLAVDWVSNLLYFTDEDLAVLGVASSDGRYAMILLDNDLTHPRSIALDPRNGLE